MPWAGLLATTLVVVADRTVWGRVELWRAADARLAALPPALVRVEQGIAQDRIGLLELERAAPEQHRVLCIGNSRAQDGFLFDSMPPELALVKVAHAPISPLEMCLFAREAAGHRPEVVVLLLSELDTHRPTRVVPLAGFADALAVPGIALAAGPAFVNANRVKLERLELAALSPGYRWRDVLERAWFNDLIGYEADPEGRIPQLVNRDTDEEPEPPPPVADLDGILARFQETSRRKIKNSTLNLLYEIRPGPHVELGEHLIERTVEILHAAGSEVLIVEGPLHPVSYELYDRAATRPEFLAFVERLQRDHGVAFLPLEETGPYEAGDFDDPLHLRPPRGRVLGRLLLERVGELLEVELTFPRPTIVPGESRGAEDENLKPNEFSPRGRPRPKKR